MGNGLKQVWGLNDAKGPPSTAQADQFKANYQSVLSAINTALQYTVVNAEKPKHGEKASERDELNSAYQAVIVKIDPSNPSAAQSLIEAALAKANAAKQAIAAFKADVEKDVAAWRAQEPTFDKALSMIEELEAWGHKQAETLRSIVKKIQEQVNNKVLKPALQAIVELMAKLQPIYDEYLKQKAAKEKYDPAFAGLQPKLPTTCQYQKLAEKSQEIITLQGQMEAQAKEKIYVEALALETQLEAKVAEYQTKLDELEKQKKAYEESLAKLQPNLTNATAAPQYEKLADKRKEIDTGKCDMEAAAKCEDYEKALQTATDLSPKVDTYVTAVEELEKQKKAYEDGLAALKPKLPTSCDAEYPKLAPIEQDLTTIQGEMEKAAQAEEYEPALKQQGDLSTKLDEYTKAKEELDKQKEEYERALAELQPQLTEASVCKAQFADLQPIQLDMVTIQTEMEAAAKAKDWENALRLVKDLDAKVKEYFAAIEKKKEEYKTALAAVQPKVDDCMVEARNFKDLIPDRDALSKAQKDMETAADGQDYDKAKQMVTDLGAKADAYLAKAKKAQEEHDKKGAEISKKLDDASEATRGDVAKAIANGMAGKPEDIKHLPIDVRNRLLEEMQKGSFTDDEKQASKILLSQKFLDPEFEKLDMKSRRDLIEKMKSDPAYKKARDNWDKLTEKERIDIMQKTIDYQAEIYGIPQASVKAFDPPVKDGDYGSYSHKTGTLNINTHDSVLKKGGFDEAINTAVHEMGHRQQAVMVDDLSAPPPPDGPKIKKGDPNYNQAQSFKLNDTQRGYYVYPPEGKPPFPPGNGPEYFTQPQENHSRENGDQIGAAGIGK